MNSAIPYAELQIYFDNSGFVLKTQHQILKDFASYRLFFNERFSQESLSKDEIVDAISEQLGVIILEGETRLMQLLYTIDLPEQEFLSLTTENNFLRLLSEKILFREAYKVYLRMQFSQK
jgi:hypothetical protein